MTLRSEIREALASGPHTAAMLAEACDSASDATQVSSNLHQLSKEGKIKKVGEVGGRANWALADWPEKGMHGAASPEPDGKRAKKRSKPKPRAPAAPTPEIAAHNGHGTQFAVTSEGCLAIKQGEISLQIEPADFARLRKFTEQVESVWSGA